MPMPRSQLISLDATPHYHVVSRCVRRQFLCGVDVQTGRDFTHRRDWIRTRIFELAEVFAIGVCAYAVMSNHCHLVLSVDQERALGWDDREVGRRWMALFGGTALNVGRKTRSIPPAIRHALQRRDRDAASGDRRPGLIYN